MASTNDLIELGNSMRKLYEDGGGEITVRLSDNKSLQVHAAIISNVSSVFAKMFAGPWTEGQKREIDMTFATLESAEYMFRFMYYREKNIPYGISNMFSLMILTDKYDLSSYTKHVKTAIIQSIETISLLPIIGASVECGILGTEILSACADFIVADILGREETPCYDSGAVGARFCCFHETKKNFTVEASYCAYYTNSEIDIPISADMSLCCLHGKKISVPWGVDEIRLLPVEIKDEVLLKLLSK